MQNLQQIIAKAQTELTEKIMGLHSLQQYQGHWNDQIDRFVRRHTNRILSETSSHIDRFLEHMRTLHNSVADEAVQDFRAQPSDALFHEFPPACKRHARLSIAYLIDTIAQRKGGTNDTR